MLEGSGIWQCVEFYFGCAFDCFRTFTPRYNRYGMADNDGAPSWGLVYGNVTPSSAGVTHFERDLVSVSPAMTIHPLCWLTQFQNEIRSSALTNYRSIMLENFLIRSYPRGKRINQVPDPISTTSADILAPLASARKRNNNVGNNNASKEDSNNHLANDEDARLDVNLALPEQEDHGMERRVVKVWRKSGA